MSYDITSKTRVTLLGGMAIGILCLALSWFGDDTGMHTRFWSNFLHNSVYFTGIALMACFFMTASITAWAGWYVVFKRVWESMSMFMIVGLVLMGIMALSVYLDWSHLYHWQDLSLINDPSSPEYDPILAGKAGFLNKNFYLFGTFAMIGAWVFIASKIRSLSLAEEKNGADGFNYHYRVRWWAAAFLPIFGFGMAAMVWQWIMSVDAHWYSTLFAWYCGASWFVAMICLTIMILLFLKSQGHFKNVSTEHFHDLGKFLFAISIFWTYLWFSQFMLIWYANVGEETVYFHERMHDYPVLFYGNLIVNFLLPFFVLMRNDTKRKMGSLAFTAGIVFVGHWVDFFLMLKPGILHTAHAMAGHGHGDHGDSHGHGDAAHGAHDAGHGAHGAAEVVLGPAHHGETIFELGYTLPGFLEIGTMVGFLCLFLFFVLNSLSSVSLQSSSDPYIEESVHHHT